MSARHRCLCQSRGVIRIIGLVIQSKRGGLAVRRFFINLGQALAKVFAAWFGFLQWLLGRPRVVVGWLWTSLFWPVDPTEPVEAECRRFAHLEQLSENPFAPPSPSYWEQLQTLAGCSMCAMRKSARVSSIQIRRAGLRAQRAVQKPTPWTWASVTGSLGVLLMIIVQVSYSFQSREETKAQSLAKAHPKTRIDPGFPQHRDSNDEMLELAQVDPFSPTEPNPFPEPVPDENPTDLKPRTNPWDNAPALEQNPKVENRAPQTEEDPWVDPLDTLPPSTAPLNPEPHPLANFPSPERDPGPPLQYLPNEFPQFDPSATPSQAPVDPVPNFPPANTDPIPPKDEAEPWVDPLDNLPPVEPVPIEQRPPVEPAPEFPEFKPVSNSPRSESEEFIDPLDNLPPFNPVPQDPRPMPVPMEPAWPPMESNSPVELGVGFVRLPKDDTERFQYESGITSRRGLEQGLPLDEWDRRLQQDRQDSLTPRPYWERLSQAEKARLSEEIQPTASQRDYDIGPEESRARLTVGLEKHLPPESTAREPLRYEIVVQNRGREMIDAVEVDESVPPTHQLTDVSPAGFFEDNLLRWRLKELRPGEERRLQVEVVPTESGTIETTTSIRPSIQVASMTNVERTASTPTRSDMLSSPIRLRRSGYRNIGINEAVLFTNHVQNLSTASQNDVEVIEEVPKGFRVVKVEDDGVYDRQTGTITWTLAALPRGETVEFGVVLQAASQGELESRVKGSTSEGEAVPIRARVQAEQLPIRPTAPQTPCRCPCCCCAACRCR